MGKYQSLYLQKTVGETASGNLLDVDGISFVGIQVSGTFVGTVTFEATIDGDNWVSVEGASVGDSTSLSTTATAPGIWRISVLGLSTIRARISAYTSGAITVLALGED